MILLLANTLRTTASALLVTSSLVAVVLLTRKSMSKATPCFEAGATPLEDNTAISIVGIKVKISGIAKSSAIT
jgi:hypothetical protein